MPVPQEAGRTIFLVNPRTPGTRLAIGPYSLGAPMGLGVVGSMAEDVVGKSGFGREVDIRVVDEDLNQRLEPKKGDLVLVSSFSLTAKRVGTLIRQVNDQGIPVVVGGIHASVMPDDFSKERGISFIGEAGNSEAFRQLMNRWLHEGTLDWGQNIVSEGYDHPIELAGLPVSANVYNALDRRRFVHGTFATVGCPHDCGFCTVIAGRVIRRRPPKEVVEEIKLRGLDKMGFTLADSNLGAGGEDGMKYLHQLLEAFAPLKIPSAWNAETTIQTLDRGGEELLRALAKGHCHRLYVGIESPDKTNLRTVGKRHNLKFDKTRVGEIVRQAHLQGVKITGLFIVGFLTDTVETISAIEQYIKDTQLDDANICILTPLPGSRIWDEFAAAGLFDPQTVNTDTLDLRHLVFKHPLGNKNLLEEYDRLCREVFSTPVVISRATRAFFRSLYHHLPESFIAAVRTSYGTDLLSIYAHRNGGLRHLIDFANDVYDVRRQLSG